MIGVSKKELRVIAKNKRSQINKPDAASKLCANFLKNILLKPNSIIAIYSPTQNEIDVIPLGKKLIQLGHKICLPVIKGDILEFHEWDGAEELVESKYNIKTPKPNTQHLTPNYIIVPFLAFDSTKHRLGYGGGYYDKTMHSMTAIKIGVGYAEQQVDKIPTNETDIKLDFIVTDEKLL